MSIVEFDGPPSWCERNWGEYNMPVGRCGGVRHPHALSPTATTHGHFVLSLVETKMATRRTQRSVNDRHLLSHGKIGDCEQSTIM